MLPGSDSNKSQSSFFESIEQESNKSSFTVNRQKFLGPNTTYATSKNQNQFTTSSPIKPFIQKERSFIFKKSANQLSDYMPYRREFQKRNEELNNILHAHKEILEEQLKNDKLGEEADKKLKEANQHLQNVLNLLTSANKMVTCATEQSMKIRKQARDLQKKENQIQSKLLVAKDQMILSYKHVQQFQDEEYMSLNHQIEIPSKK